MKAPDLKLDQASPGSDARERITQRLAHLTRYHPSRAALFRSVYYGKPSKSRALKAKCLDCCGWQAAEIRDCQSVTCPLWRVRPYQEGARASETARSKRFSELKSTARVETAEAA